VQPRSSARVCLPFNPESMHRGIARVGAPPQACLFREDNEGILAW